MGPLWGTMAKKKIEIQNQGINGWHRFFGSKHLLSSKNKKSDNIIYEETKQKLDPFV